MLSPDGSMFRATVNASGFDFSYFGSDDQQSRLHRMLGCAFVSFMPQAGLNEALSTLADYFEYFAVTPPRPELAAATSETLVDGQMIGIVSSGEAVVSS